MLKNYIKLWDEIKEQIELITGDKEVKYSKHFMKIKFKTNNDLPLSRIINIPGCVIVISNTFKDDNECHPQVLLHHF